MKGADDDLHGTSDGREFACDGDGDFAILAIHQAKNLAGGEVLEIPGRGISLFGEAALNAYGSLRLGWHRWHYIREWGNAEMRGSIRGAIRIAAT
jgi:hypothetical protein